MLLPAGACINTNKNKVSKFLLQETFKNLQEPLNVVYEPSKVENCHSFMHYYIYIVQNFDQGDFDKLD